MKNIAGTLILVIFAIKLSAQSYIPVDQSSKVTFTIKNFGFNVGGSFSGLKGSIRFDPAEINKAYFDVTVDANTINTDNNMRDNHLREESYFDVKNHPLIRFESTKITESNRKGTLFIFGKLTLKNKSLDISFPFTATPSENGFVFDGVFKINRRDFEIGGSSTLSDNVIITLHVQATK